MLKSGRCSRPRTEIGSAEACSELNPSSQPCGLCCATRRQVDIECSTSQSNSRNGGLRAFNRMLHSRGRKMGAVQAFAKHVHVGEACRMLRLSQLRT